MTELVCKVRERASEMGRWTTTTSGLPARATIGAGDVELFLPRPARLVVEETGKGHG